MNALRKAIIENWKSLSPVPPGFWPDFEEVLGAPATDELIAELERSGDFNDSLIAYSPETCHQLFYQFSKTFDDSVTLEVSIPAAAIDEVEGTVERGKMLDKLRWRGQTKFRVGLPGPDEMAPEELRRWYEEYDRHGQTPSIWPKNRKCFLNIVEHLKKALPVKTVELDPRLLDDPAKS